MITPTVPDPNEKPRHLRLVPLVEPAIEFERFVKHHDALFRSSVASALRNDATVAIGVDGFRRFWEVTGHTPRLLDLDVTAQV